VAGFTATPDGVKPTWTVARIHPGPAVGGATTGGVLVGVGGPGVGLGGNGVSVGVGVSVEVGVGEGRTWIVAVLDGVPAIALVEVGEADWLLGGAQPGTTTTTTVVRSRRARKVDVLLAPITPTL